MNSNEEDFNQENRTFTNEIQTNLQNDMIEPEYSINDAQPDYKFAGFWMRFWAYLLDIVVIGSIDRIIVYPIFRMFDFSLSEVNMFAPVSIITAIVFYGYFVLMTKYFGQTLGKMVFGLRVVSLNNEKLSWSTIMFREWIGRFISGTILILYIVVGFLPKKQGIHDLFADTTVVHVRS
jgi:uncharacterized RDD family membrane protein YckC